MKIIRRDQVSKGEGLEDLPPFMQSILYNRGISNKTQLDKRLQSLCSFEQLLGIEEAVARLIQAIRHQESITVIGDFDADGATSTALVVSALRQFGAQQVQFLVPNRFSFGYGLSPEIVEVAAEKDPQLLITVDNGISCLAGVARANALGIDVIVTDHHLAGEALPEACAIVNPNQPGCPFPSKCIAGVGVIFYVMSALRRSLVNEGWFMQQNIAEPNMAEFLDLVALGTVADVVALDQNNRILVRQGIQRIRAGRVRPGIEALLKVAGKTLAHIRETDLGFAVAPRLNAAGRLDDMSLGIECLLSENMTIANHRASELDQLNHERRHIEAEMKTQAFAFIEQLQAKVPAGDSLPVALCFFDESWHQGVIGILAGRLKEKYHRPVIIFSQVSDTEMKGSARSIQGLNIRDVLANIDKDYPDVIRKFGGHAMAAGLSICPAQLKTFKQAFIQEVSKYVSASDLEGELLSDGALPQEYLSMDTAQLLQDYGPWGQSFPEPIFDDVFEVMEQRIVGQNHLKLALVHPQTHKKLDAIAFNVDLKEWPNHRCAHVHIAYKLDINIYQNRARLQLMVENIAPAKIDASVMAMREELGQYSW